MALSPKITALVANAMLDALSVLLDGGVLRFYDSTGTGQPATPETAVSTQVLLAEVTLNADFAPGAAIHLLTANVLTADPAVNASGTATWFRAFKADGITPVLDGSVGIAGCDINLVNNVLVKDGTLTITSFTINLPVA